MAKEKFYSLWGKATDRQGQTHYVTVVGKFTQEKVTTTLPTETVVVDENLKEHNALLMVDYKYKKRVFQMAKSICDPRDTFSYERGVDIAKKRLERGEKHDLVGTLESTDVTMLNDDMCNILIFNEVNHIIKNIDAYIN